MKNLVRELRSTLFRLAHSKVLLLHLLVPLLGIVIFSFYYAYSPLNQYNKIALFVQAVALAFPLLIAIAVTMFYEEESQAGHFQRILTAPYSKTISHSAQLISLCLLGLCACFVTVVGFGVIFRMMGYTALDLIMFLKLAIMLFSANLALYILQYMICFMGGKGLSLGFGIIGTLLSPLLYLGLGDIIWQYIPCGYGIRLSTYYLSKLISNEHYTLMSQDFKVGLITTSCLTTILLVAFIILGMRWQGSNYKSE